MRPCITQESQLSPTPCLNFERTLLLPDTEAMRRVEAARLGHMLHEKYCVCDLSTHWSGWLEPGCDLKHWLKIITPPG